MEKPVDSPVARVQRNTDQTVAEAISFNNEINDYAQRLDQIGEEIKSYSHATSPGGAAKLTAESMGVMIHVMDQQMRATGTKLKASSPSYGSPKQKKKRIRPASTLKRAKSLRSAWQRLIPTFNFRGFNDGYELARHRS